MASVADNVSGKSVSTANRRRFLSVALAALTFVIYGCTIFSLPQVRDARYCCEQSSFAAAVSNVCTEPSSARYIPACLITSSRILTSRSS